jgi:ribosomal protein L7Ae-like RNA K-turn-binding protein
MYSDTAHAQKAAAEFDGMVIGGQIVSAAQPATTLSTVVAISETNKDAPSSIGGKQDDGSATDSAGEKRKPSENEEANVLKKARTDEQPLYSGDKLIPECFAECKRVPKIPNVAGPREYAKLVNDERVRPLLQEMLGELMRLQKRAMEDKNAKARRCLVMGLGEVARGIRAHKVKMVVMANNLDEYGAIDDKLQEIVDLAHSEDIPLFFEFTKRSLGKAVGKSIKVAVVGIQNADGAHQPFKKLQSIAVQM